MNEHNGRKRQKPEEIELEVKHKEFQIIETTLVNKELALATLKSEIALIQDKFKRIILPKYAAIDKLRAQILSLSEKDAVADEISQTVAAIAQEIAEKALMADEMKLAEKNDFQSTDALKQLFREAARAMHPDFANSKADHARREDFMRKVNEAYRYGDMRALKNLLEEWEASPEQVVGDDAAAKLVRVIRKIAQTKKRLVAIDKEMGDLLVSKEYQLLQKVKVAANENRDFFTELAQKLDQQIVFLDKHLREKTKDMPNL